MLLEANNRRYLVNTVIKHGHLRKHFM